MKMYVLVRKDLSSSYSAVQAGHALAQYLIDYPDNIGYRDDEWCNGTLVYLAVDTEDSLVNWAATLNSHDIQYSEFVEPDIGDEITALAALDHPDGRLQELFKRLPLL